MMTTSIEKIETVGTTYSRLLYYCMYRYCRLQYKMTDSTYSTTVLYRSTTGTLDGD